MFCPVQLNAWGTSCEACTSYNAPATNSFFGRVDQLALHHCCQVLMQSTEEGLWVAARHTVSMAGCSNMLLACIEDGIL